MDRCIVIVARHAEGPARTGPSISGRALDCGDGWADPSQGSSEIRVVGLSALTKPDGHHNGLFTFEPDATRDTHASSGLELEPGL